MKVKCTARNIGRYRICNMKGNEICKLHKCSKDVCNCLSGGMYMESIDLSKKEGGKK